MIRDLQGRIKAKVHADGSTVRILRPSRRWVELRTGANQVNRLDDNLDGRVRQQSYLHAVSRHRA